MSATSIDVAGAGRARSAGVLAAAAALAVGLVGCGSQTGAGTVDGLPVLHIGSSSGGQPALDSSGGRDIATAVLDGSLPTGPSEGPVVRFTGGPDDGDVGALAQALGLSADVEEHPHGWSVEDGGAVLRVRSDAAGQWAFSRSGDECPTYWLDVDAATTDSAVACAVADPAGAPQEAAPVPSDDVALQLAAPVLAAIDADGDPRVRDGSTKDARSVVLDPSVAGLPTAGLRTVVDVDRLGVVAATGWLGAAGDAVDYPIMSARAAFDRFASAPRPEPAIACLPPDDQGSPAVDGEASGGAAPDAPSASDLPLPVGCAAEPIVVTGAELGLTMRRDGDEPVLVAAWLLQVRGSDEPVAVVAVEDRFLADPEPGGGATASVEPPSTGGGTPGDPGLSPEPVPTETPAAPPSDPGTDPSSGTGGGDVAAVTRAYLDTDGTTLALVGWGGVCSEYSGIADEAPDAVKVQIVGRATPGAGEACVAMAQEVKVVVQLREPLGSRALVDATTGQRVPVTRT